jgi:putative FmdB family regulatory protein
MPIYDYKCNDCYKTYDVFHKVREVVEDVVCPTCGSAKHTRLLSAPSFSMGSQPDAFRQTGGCRGGSWPELVGQ